MFELILAYHPNRLDETHPLVIQDLLELVEESKQVCVNKCVQMLTDLHQNGLKSRYLKPLFGAVYELKDRTSQGGARVYFVIDNKNQFHIAHAECKTENQASRWMLAECAQIVQALETNQPILPKPRSA